MSIQTALEKIISVYTVTKQNNEKVEGLRSKHPHDKQRDRYDIFAVNV